MIVRSPAKLNMRLKVIDQRPDGYHNLVSIMVPVHLFDVIELKTHRTPGIRLSCRGLHVPESPDNLVIRAARAFFSRTGLEDHLSIKLTKVIPVAAGLGGGSSNAACTLKALNELYSGPLTFHELEELAIELGADVPFFLQERPCIARGIGEILEPIQNWPEFWYVIVMPPFTVPTSWVYANLNLALTKDEYAYILQCLADNPFDIAGILENDLERVTAARFPVISLIKELLLDAGAKGALMSGSGPSVFGIFGSEDKAIAAEQHLVVKDIGKIFVARGLD